MGVARRDADLSDIQGNILRGYRSFPFARFLFFKINSPPFGRAFINELLTTRVTPGKWLSKPCATTNVAFTFRGLAALQLDAQCLASFPPEFQEGMKQRARLLGDFGPSDPKASDPKECWDEPWRSDHVHVLVSCYASNLEKLEEHCQDLWGDLSKITVAIDGEKKSLVGAHGIEQLTPHQDAAMLVVNGKPSRVEHFGFQDGLSNPDIERVRGDGGGTGNPEAALGEFVLGHRAEGGEVAPMPAPKALSQNGSFLVLRKLEQDVLGFRRFVREQAVLLQQVLGSTLPAETNAEEFLAAKMMGRWRDGSPLDRYPTKPANHPSNKFSYAKDPDGARCPLGAHTRRANPRASLAFGGQLVLRRRLIRRGIPYGEYLPDNADRADGASRGIMFQVFNASIERQFEFVQREWINNGDVFRQGDDTDPITGSRYHDGRTVVPDGEPLNRSSEGGAGRMVIPGDERTGRPPFLCCDIPRFVTTKGGDYFFVPSLTGLRLLASGKVFV